MFPMRIRPAVLIALFMGAAIQNVTRADVQLRGERWGITVRPERLGIEARVADGNEPFVISSPAPTDLRVADLKSDDRRVAWTIPDQNVIVNVHLDADVLLVDFEAKSAGEMTWPIVKTDANIRAYILPMFEGLYVPADDEPLAKFLIGESPMTTTAGLSMPFWGVDIGGGHSLTYILTNAFNNELTFERNGGRIGLRLTHAFTRNQDVKRFGYRIHLADASPVMPAKLYRQYLIDTKQFVSMKQKIEQTPDAAKLLGAAHIYLWGDGLITRNDVKDYKKLALALMNTENSFAKGIRTKLSDEARKIVQALPTADHVDNYQKGIVVEELSRILKDDDVAIAKKNCAEFYAAFRELLNPPVTWGDGFSPRMVDQLVSAGIERAWLGSPNWDGLKFHPEFVHDAMEKGYLVGPYDSFHSIHAAAERDTWETAQFRDNPTLFESGAIVKADGSKRAGFKQKGHLLSPVAARPFVEKRVAHLMNQFRCNSWFIDCDAFGEVFDDYSPAHPATQAGDAAARLSRMAWIRDTYHAVIGSEGGSAYAAPVIHFAHGMMTPVIAWGDTDLMKNKQSKFYLGAYYPPDQPAIVFKQVPMKDEHRRIYADPRFRLPLYETVFHDSVVATHEWGYGSLKFEDPGRARELLELLYGVPPLYHLNQAEWQKRKDEIAKHVAFITPLHRETGLLPMTRFEWLTDDRLVQRTMFGDALEIIANFGDSAYRAGDVEVAAHSVVASHAGFRPTSRYP